MTSPVIEMNASIRRRYFARDARAVDAGLVPPNSRAVGRDAFTNVAARMGYGTPNLAEGADYVLYRLSFDYWLLITLYENHWISRRIVDTPAQDMVRAWPTINSDLPPEDLTRMDKCLMKTRSKGAILTALKWARLFGGAGALIVIDGQENQLEEPLDLKNVEPGSFRGLVPFDRWSGISPSGDIEYDFERPSDFNLPKFYRVRQPGGTNFQVHASRILRFTGPTVPTPELEAHSWWGISSLAPAYEEIRKRDNLSWSLLSVMMRASILGIRFKELAQALSGAGMNQVALQAFYARMEAINHTLSSQSLVVLPEEGGFESVINPMTGYAEVYQQFQLDIAGAANLPVSRLFGRTITGLAQSNDADERLYEERIALEQEESLRPQLEKLYPVIAMSELGEVPKDMDISFPSVRVLTEEEKSTLAKTTTDNIVALVNAGLLTKPQALKELKQQSDLTGVFTNLTDDDIQAAEREEELNPGGGLGETLPEELGGVPAEKNLKLTRAADAWEERKHPREKGGSEAGQFASSGAGGSSSALAPAPKDRQEWPEHMEK